MSGGERHHREAMLSSRPIYQGIVVDLSVDRVLLPNGRETDLEMIRHPGAAVVLPVETGEDGIAWAILVRQYRYAAGGWLLEVPGGKLDGGEPPEECARRELEEEIGLHPVTLQPLGWIWTTPGFTDERIWLYLAQDLRPVAEGARPDDHEVLQIERVPLAEAVERASRGDITDAKTVVSLLRAAAALGMAPGR